MTTHKIASRIFKEPMVVETMHRVGVWAVNVDPDSHQYVVTHTPTGGAIVFCDRKDDAIAVTDALGVAAGDWAIDAPWGDPKEHPDYWAKHSEVGRLLKDQARAIVQVRLIASVTQ